jgi:hypothetical protein
LKLTDLQIWPNHVKRVLDVLYLALDKLAAEDGLPLGEKDLNLTFSACVRSANLQLRRDGRGVEWPPSFDGIKGRFPGEEGDSADAEKRPDISWSMYDSEEPSPERQERAFDVECKRLGKPTSKSWLLTEQYVISGIRRYIRSTHRYGRNATDGAMVGYVQDASLRELLDEVNLYCRRHGLPDIMLSEDGWRPDSISRLQQALTRHDMPSPYGLVHLWPDLRRNYVMA